MIGDYGRFLNVSDSGRWTISPGWGRETKPTGSRLNTHTFPVGRGILNPDSIKIAWVGRETQLCCGSSILLGKTKAVENRLGTSTEALLTELALADS
jgi:hypothetical protein